MNFIKSKWLVFILLSLFLSSCAARKVNIDKVDSTVKVDSVSITKQETITTQDNHISIVTNTDELEIVPIDTTKAIVIDGKSYKNATLRYKKSQIVLVDTTKIKVAKKAHIEVKVKKDIKVKTAKKEIDKKTNYTLFFGIILIILILLVSLYLYNKFSKLSL
jgi:hypothetical protein